MHRVTRKCELERISQTYQPGKVENCLAQSKQLTGPAWAVLTEVLPRTSEEARARQQNQQLRNLQQQQQQQKHDANGSSAGGWRYRRHTGIKSNAGGESGGDGADITSNSADTGGIWNSGRFMFGEAASSSCCSSVVPSSSDPLTLARVVSTVMEKKVIRDGPGFKMLFEKNLTAIQNVTRIMVLIQQYASQTYNCQKEHHERMLSRLWDLMMPDQRLGGRVSKDWAALGFQGQDPATDFRGSGLLGLGNLLFFAEYYNGEARAMLKESHHPFMWYSFAVAGINISAWLHQWLVDRPGVNYYQWQPPENNPAASVMSSGDSGTTASGPATAAAPVDSSGVSTAREAQGAVSGSGSVSTTGIALGKSRTSAAAAAPPCSAVSSAARHHQHRRERPLLHNTEDEYEEDDCGAADGKAEKNGGNGASSAGGAGDDVEAGGDTLGVEVTEKKCGTASVVPSSSSRGGKQFGGLKDPLEEGGGGESKRHRRRSAKRSSGNARAIQPVTDSPSSSSISSFTTQSGHSSLLQQLREENGKAFSVEAAECDEKKPLRGGNDNSNNATKIRGSHRDDGNGTADNTNYNTYDSGAGAVLSTESWKARSETVGNDDDSNSGSNAVLEKGERNDDFDPFGLRGTAVSSLLAASPPPCSSPPLSCTLSRGGGACVGPTQLKAAPPSNLHQFFHKAHSDVEGIRIFNKLYVFVFCCFHQYWFASKPRSVMDFPRVAANFKRELRLPPYPEMLDEILRLKEKDQKRGTPGLPCVLPAGASAPPGSVPVSISLDGGTGKCASLEGVKGNRPDCELRRRKS